jgi:hypothetical protein
VSGFFSRHTSFHYGKMRDRISAMPAILSNIITFIPGDTGQPVAVLSE